MAERAEVQEVLSGWARRSNREIARVTDIPRTTVNRIMGGGAVDLATYRMLCHRLGMHPAAVLIAAEAGCPVLTRAAAGVFLHHWVTAPASTIVPVVGHRVEALTVDVVTRACRQVVDAV